MAKRFMGGGITNLDIIREFMLTERERGHADEYQEEIMQCKTLEELMEVVHQWGNSDLMSESAAVYILNTLDKDNR